MPLWNHKYHKSYDQQPASASELQWAYIRLRETFGRLRGTYARIQGGSTETGSAEGLTSAYATPSVAYTGPTRDLAYEALTTTRKEKHRQLRNKHGKVKKAKKINETNENQGKSKNINKNVNEILRSSLKIQELWDHPGVTLESLVRISDMSSTILAHIRKDVDESDII